MLWLPPDYRESKLAVVGSTVAIGYHTGRVLVMKFSWSGRSHNYFFGYKPPFSGSQ